MDSHQGLPAYDGPYDMMRLGFQSLESEFNAKHEVDKIQKKSNEYEWNSKMDRIQRIYGAHMAMRLTAEREMF